MIFISGFQAQNGPGFNIAGQVMRTVRFILTVS